MIADNQIAATGGREAAAGGRGLVSFKTSDLTINDSISIPQDHESKMTRRVGRLKRTVWVSGHLHKFAHVRGERVWFVTLTYRGVDDWQPGHITKAIKNCRDWLARRVIGAKLRYTWVAELQKRGAVHYHVALWLPKGLTVPKWDKQGWWPHGMTQVVKSVNPIGYLMKYLSKVGAFHKFPAGCRLFGIGGLDSQARKIRTWINYPQWLKQSVGVGEIRRTPSGYLVHATGELLKSPWRVVWTRAGLFLSSIAPVPVTWAHGPYSTWEPL